MHSLKTIRRGIALGISSNKSAFQLYHLATQARGLRRLWHVRRVRRNLFGSLVIPILVLVVLLVLLLLGLLVLVLLDGRLGNQLLKN